MPKLSKRVCRWCRREYKEPSGSKTAGCPDCAPRLIETPVAAGEAGR